MDKSKSKDVLIKDGDKLFICVETNEEGIADFKRTAKYENRDVEIVYMQVDGKMVPAFKFAVPDLDWYQKYSSLELRDKDENVDPYELERERYSTADAYLKLLHDFIDYVREKYPKYAHYTELIEILGEEVEVKEAARLNRSDKTLYGWLKCLRPIFEEFKDTVDYL